MGRLIDKLIAIRANANDHRTPEGKATQELRDQIAVTQPSSFVKAVLARASTRVPSEIALLADLVSRHGRRLEGETLRIPSALQTDFTAALMNWGEELLASTNRIGYISQKLQWPSVACHNLSSQRFWVGCYQQIYHFGAMLATR